MDELYGDILALRPLLRQAGQEEAAKALLEALTDACGPRDILDNLRNVLADFPPGLGPEILTLKDRIESRVEAHWADLP